jgi:hypothetical protein
MSIISPSKRFTCLLFVILITFIMPSAWPLSRGWTSNRAFAFDAPTATPRPAAPTQRARIADAFARLPLRFEANSNPRYPAATFSARASGYSLWVAPTEAVLELALPEAAAPRSGDRLTALHMQMLGANPAARVGGREELVGKSNYFVGSDASKWRTNIATYAGVAVENIYPGVEVVYYGQGRELEYDFKLAVGADYKVIGMRFEGARGVRVDEAGELVMETAAGQMRQHKPVAYQLIDGARREVVAGYQLKGKSVVGFSLGDYDKRQPLIIDPVLAYSTFFGGDGEDAINRVALDSQGYVYVTGTTDSTNFPIRPSEVPLPGDLRFIFSVGFISKLDLTNRSLVYSVYLGGNRSPALGGALTECLAIAVDSSGNAYVTGKTNAVQFPTTAGAFQTALAGNSPDAFVAKLNATGNALVYSTYLGSSKSSDFPQIFGEIGLEPVMNFERGKPHILLILSVQRLSQSTASPSDSSRGAFFANFRRICTSKVHNRL